MRRNNGNPLYLATGGHAIWRVPSQDGFAISRAPRNIANREIYRRAWNGQRVFPTRPRKAREGAAEGRISEDSESEFTMRGR